MGGTVRASWSLWMMIALAIWLVGSIAPALGQASANLCARTFWAENPSGRALGIVPSDAERLIHQVAKSIGLPNSTDIIVVQCRYASKVGAWYAPEGLPGVREGEYIIYDPTWVREVIGNDRMQAIVLFGHELGHLLNRHFTARRGLSSVVKEKEADHFAGCAVARMGGDWPTLENLLSRLRSDSDELYPNRLASLDAAKQGFVDCGGSTRAASNAPTPLGVPSANPSSTTLRHFMIFFDFDRANLSAGASETVRQAALRYKLGAHSNVTVAGHDDTASDEAYSMALSLRRANAVKEVLVSEGVPAAAISVVGRGQKGLLVMTARGVREPQNRRVEIELR